MHDPNLLNSISATASESQSKIKLKKAVGACLKLSPIGDCAKGPHGAIASWDVSSVTDTSSLFAGTASFNGDISKWDVAKVTNMYRMFYGATSFDADISEWDVSRVTNMGYMFHGAASFNVDISNWSVVKVTDMKYMFRGATSFARTLCKAWRISKAPKTKMFAGSGGKLCVGLFQISSLPLFHY